MRFSLAALIGLLALAACSIRSSSETEQSQGEATEPAATATGLVTDQSVSINGVERVYDLYLPENLQAGAPLVVLLHGNRASRDDLTGRSRTTAPFERWLRIADDDGLILLIPQGAEGADGNTGWNDCRTDAAGNSVADDVGFITAAMDDLAAANDLDLDRVYAVGISNGGHMAQRLADEAAERFAGIAVIAAGAPVNSSCEPATVPISALFMWGTADPLAPYGGGAMAGDRGQIFSADETIDRWIERNATSSTPIATSFEDLDGGDDSTVERFLYDGGADDTAVALYRVDGGGHTEPSIDAQYRRVFERLIGRQNHDIEMADEVWSFFTQFG